MPITVRWYDEPRRIWYQEFDRAWTLDDYWESVEVTHRALDAVAPHGVYLMTQILGRLQTPPGFLSALRTAGGRVRPHERVHVVAGGGFMVRSFYRLGNAISSAQHVRLVDTLDQALTIIEQEIARDLSQKG